MKDGVKRRGSLDRRVVGSRGHNIRDNCDVDARLVSGKIAQDAVAFFLGSNGTADRAAVLKQLGEDVGSDEAVGSGEKNATSHFNVVL